MVACAMLVVSVRMKSSAVSVSRWRQLAGCDNVPSSPSGVPVLKKKGSAQAGVASHSPAVTAAATNRCLHKTLLSLFGSGEFGLKA